jgi:hypothetical protein
MPTLPRPTIDAIYSTYKQDDIRTYLGASELGESCMRRLWYSFRLVKKQTFKGRILRLFDTGKREEVRVLEELKKIGVTIYDIDPNTGNQFGYFACNGHLGGHLDAVGVGFKESDKPHVVEIKTHNLKSFNDLEKHGAEKSKPRHYVQVQLYMGMADIDRAAYLAVCKDNDELYFERVCFDKQFYNQQLAKASRIINAKTPLEKISEDPSFYTCKMCDCSDICHHGADCERNCRTCIHSEPVEDGGWFCNESDLTNDGKSFECKYHVFIADLDTVPF